ncbi:hypothetical protein [Microbulbifer yueqingensis]|uniref:Uncharacterized protein n=1 Tax=Microbulbifer yueqingensis TaxID=658219 RepID=A0A1G8XN28_9GAMM|nr:hypothetical protein [Microbulbifer yueqingensis]SDJ91948.1 hypothetical protein SAMN05216212_1169 [Microbulbifer yueqingensis]
MTEILDSLPLWLWFTLALLVLFVARQPVHQAISTLGRIAQQSLRLAAKAVSGAERRLQARNREVMLASGLEAAERSVEREFERIEATMKRELAQYPTLHRRLCEQLTAIDEDYVRSAEVPPEPSNWAKAIKAVCEIPATQDPVVGDVLEIIHHSMRKSEAKALEAYRESSKERHQLLKRMVPHWRSILKRLGRVNKNVESVIRRATALDGHMRRYEDIQQGSDRAVRRLSSSSLSQFFISAFVLVILAGGALVNFHLIARPLAELVGGGAAIGAYPLADTTAGVILLLQIGLGVFLLECLGVTRMVPALGSLGDVLRKRLAWAAGGLLLALACSEAGLAFTREVVIQGDLTDRAAAAGDISWVSTTAQMLLGFVLPLVLAFTAVPLEGFVASARNVLGMLAALVLRSLSTILRLVGAVLLHCSDLLIRLYDIVIFLPLWLESRYEGWRRSSRTLETVEDSA